MTPQKVHKHGEGHKDGWFNLGVERNPVVSDMWRCSGKKCHLMDMYKHMFTHVQLWLRHRYIDYRFDLNRPTSRQNIKTVIWLWFSCCVRGKCEGLRLCSLAGDRQQQVSAIEIQIMHFRVDDRGEYTCMSASVPVEKQVKCGFNTRVNSCEHGSWGERSPQNGALTATLTSCHLSKCVMLNIL